MSDLSQELNLSLFDAPPPESYVQAKDFVRWCCSFGGDFRNSPDITNLRYWAQKNRVKIHERSEQEILESARPLFLKRIERLVKSSEGASAPN